MPQRVSCLYGVIGAAVGVAFGQVPRYDVTDLGAQVKVADVWRSYAFDINSRGDVTGYVLLDSGGRKAVIWSDGVGDVIDTSRYEDRTPIAINDDGVLVGGSPGVATGWVFDGEFRCVPEFLWCASFEYLWSASAPRDINNGGVFVGGLSRNDGTGPVEAYLGRVNDEGAIEIELLGLFEGSETYGNAINDSGEALIWSGPYDDSRALVYRDGGLEALPDLGGSYNRPFAINDIGLAVGFATRTPEFTFPYDGSPVVWCLDTDPVSLTELSTPDGADYAFAYAVNNLGVIVGAAFTRDPDYVEEALIWIDGERFRLDDLIRADSGWTLGVAHAINDRGQIVGIGVKDGEVAAPRAFLLTPRDGRPVWGSGAGVEPGPATIRERP